MTAMRSRSSVPKNSVFKPMYPEDACVQMELLGHNFFVFLNAETEEVNVVIREKEIPTV